MNLNLSPRTLNEYVGNEKVKSILAISINAVKLKNDIPSHILISGERGTGKTTLGKLIANELNMTHKVITGDSINKLADLTNIFLNLPDFLIIDEVHGLKSNISDSMHQALDSFKFTFIDEENQVQTIDLKHFCLIGLTTDPGLLTSPFYSRFPKKYHLLPYTVFNLQKIIMQVAKNNQINIDSEAAFSIATRSFGIPRIALSHFQNVFEYALKFNDGVINNSMVLKCFELHEIDKKGLDGVQIRILQILSSSKKPIGGESLAQAVGVGLEGLFKIYEPPLLSAALIRRSSTGREITNAGRAHIRANMRH
jgi:Holliday junction DNA helicase RuvB